MPLDKVLSIYIGLGESGKPVIYSILDYWGVPVLYAHAQETGWNVANHSSSGDSKLISQTEMDELVGNTTNNCLMITWAHNEHYPKAQRVDLECKNIELSDRRQFFQVKDCGDTMVHLQQKLKSPGTTSKCLSYILIFRLHIIRTNLISRGDARKVLIPNDRRVSEEPDFATSSSKSSNDLPAFTSKQFKSSETSSVSLSNINSTSNHRPDISEVSGGDGSSDAEHITISALPDASVEDAHRNTVARTLLCNIFGNQIELEDFLTLPDGAKRKLSVEFKLGHKKARFDYEL